jgi:hypothetical protein
VALITSADLDARQIEYVDAAHAAAAIADASAVARSYVAPVLDAVDSPDTPDVVVAVVCGMVRRLLTNPRGLAQETLGDYSYAAGANAVATLIPTARERRMLRQAAAAYAVANDIDFEAWGADGIHMRSELPGPVDPWAVEL